VRVALAPTRPVIVPAITIATRSPLANVSVATVAIRVPAVTVFATVAVLRSIVPVSRFVPDPGACVPVHFATCNVPDVDPVERSRLKLVSFYAAQ